MKKKIIRIPLLILLLVALIVPTSCGMEGDPLYEMFTQNVLPGTDSTYTVGASGNEYLAGYFDSLFIAGDGVVTSTATISDHSIVRGDGGGRGVQDSQDGVHNVTVDDFGGLTTTGDLNVGQDLYVGNQANVTDDLDVGDNAEIHGNFTMGDAPSTFYIADDGSVTLTGTARVLKDEWLSAGAIRALGSHPATEVSHGTLETPAWRFADQAVAGNQETVSFRINTLTDMDRTVAPYVIIGWSTTTTDPGDNSEQVKWQLEYLWRSEDEDTTAGAEGTLTVTSSASTVAEGLVISQFAAMNTPSATDATIQFRLTRLSADAADTVADNVELHGICFYYTADKLGG